MNVFIIWDLIFHLVMMLYMIPNNMNYKLTKKESTNVFREDEPVRKK